MTVRVAGFLVSGNEEQLTDFHLRVYMVLNGIDRRGDTCRYTCFSEDREGAMLAAEEAGVTMEEIVGAGEDEDYLMLVQGEHRGWKNRDRAVYGDGPVGGNQ